MAHGMRLWPSAERLKLKAHIRFAHVEFENNLNLYELCWIRMNIACSVLNIIFFPNYENMVIKLETEENLFFFVFVTIPVGNGKGT
jgi:hypothetical protein